jgi:hypothetical protein
LGALVNPSDRANDARAGDVVARAVRPWWLDLLVWLAGIFPSGAVALVIILARIDSVGF